MAVTTTPNQGWLRVPIVGVAATTGGAILSLANPEGKRLIVDQIILDRVTKSTGAATADIGIGSGATTSYDTVMDNVDVGATEGVENGVTNKGTNGLGKPQLWAAANFLTITGSATTVGLVAWLYIHYFQAPAT